jgi:adenylate kinase family enzyme
MPHMPKLIVLRGNSGSGKSTVAQKLREVSSGKIAWVEQDYIRRRIMREKDVDDGVNIALISQIVEFALARGYDVVLEGILNFPRYGGMLKALADHCPEHYFFYFDVPLEETLKRHATRPSVNEFGRAEMASWYRERDTTGLPGEIIIPEHSSLDDTIRLIVETAGL